jgi:hypothetical protein
MNWDVIIVVGTVLFFAALHQWPPDGRRWEHERTRPERSPEPAAAKPAEAQARR